jgi:DNA-binding GntR family transcriptional regulator
VDNRRVDRVLLHRISTSEALVIALRSEILDGSLPPGTRLREVELSEMHGVSRQSLRSALVELGYRGLVESRPHYGVWVRRLNRADITDVYRVRDLLETEAVVHAAGDPSTWPELERIVERLERSSAGAPWMSVIDTDFEFHRALVASLQSTRLSRAHDLLEGESCLSFMRSDEDTADNVAALHRRLLETIKSGDCARAVAELRRHLAIGRERVLRGM